MNELTDEFLKQTVNSELCRLNRLGVQLLFLLDYVFCTGRCANATRMCCNLLRWHKIYIPESCRATAPHKTCNFMSRARERPTFRPMTNQVSARYQRKALLFNYSQIIPSEENVILQPIRDTIWSTPKRYVQFNFPGFSNKLLFVFGSTLWAWI